jgi:hypothetical protein
MQVTEQDGEQTQNNGPECTRSLARATRTWRLLQRRSSTRASDLTDECRQLTRSLDWAREERCIQVLEWSGFGASGHGDSDILSQLRVRQFVA